MSVVSFPAREERIWICGCGCSSFELVEDQSARCALCGSTVMADFGGWLGGMGGAPWTGGDPVRQVAGNGSEEFARRVTQKRCEAPDVCLIVVVREDGTIHAWSNLETADRRDWADRRLRDVRALLEVGR